MKTKLLFTIFLFCFGLGSLFAQEIRIKVPRTSDVYRIPASVWSQYDDILLDIVNGNQIALGFEGWINDANATNQWKPVTGSEVPPSAYNDQLILVDRKGVWTNSYKDMFKIVRVNYVADPKISVGGREPEFMSDMKLPIVAGEGEYVSIKLINVFCSTSEAKNYLFRLNSEKDTNLTPEKEVTKYNPVGVTEYRIQDRGDVHYALTVRAATFAWYPTDTIRFTVSFPKSPVANESIATQGTNIYKLAEKQVKIISEKQIEAVEVYNISGQLVYSSRVASPDYTIQVPAKGIYIVSYTQDGKKTSQKIAL